MPSRTIGIASVHRWCAWHMIAVFSFLRKRSTRPLAAGWYKVVRESRMLYSLAKAWNSCDSNCLPCSVVMVCGQPKRDIQPVGRACDTVSSVISGMGMTSGQRVKRSTAVRQYVNPVEVGRGPMTSMWTCRKRAAGGVKSPNGMTVCCET
jgi:hypothetical protein